MAVMGKAERRRIKTYKEIYETKRCPGHGTWMSEYSDAYVLFVFHLLDAGEIVWLLFPFLVLRCCVCDLRFSVVEVHLVADISTVYYHRSPYR